MRAIAVSLFAIAFLAPLSARADAYDDGVARAVLAAKNGDLAGASDELERLLPLYVEDYDLPLQLGHLYLRRGQTENAARSFRLAIARSPDAEPARAGLVIALVRARQCQEAEKEARVALAIAPSSTARSALAPCQPAPPPASAPRTEMAALGSTHRFPDHLVKSHAESAALSLDVPIRGFSLGATGRSTSVSTRDATVVPAFSQWEGYARVGVGTAFAGASLLFAVVKDGSGKLGTSEHVGAVGRLSPAGDITLSFTASVYGDGTVLQLAPEYRIPLGRFVSVTPGVALSRALGETLFNASLTLSLAGQPGSLWLGAKVGDEVRPAYLAHSVVYDIPERISWGLWAGGSVRLSDSVSIRAAYVLDRLVSTTNTSNLHTFTAGPVFRF